MKTKTEIEIETLKVRAMLEAARSRGDEDTDMLYGAQQALGWVLGELRSPTDLEDFVRTTAAKISSDR